MAKPLKLRIVSDGPLPRDFQIMDAETGEPYTNILSIRLDLDATSDFAIATVEIMDVEVDAIFKGEITKEKP